MRLEGGVHGSEMTESMDWLLGNPVSESRKPGSWGDAKAMKCCVTQLKSPFSTRSYFSYLMSITVREGSTLPN